MIGGLGLEDIHEYADPGNGTSFRYGLGVGHRVKADAYLYDLQLPSVPSDFDDPLVASLFEQSCAAIMASVRLGQLELLSAARTMVLPVRLAEAEDVPWHVAAMRYRQVAQDQPEPEGAKLSILALRTDRGYINKVRLTLEDTEETREIAFGALHRFLSEWLLALRRCE